MMAVLMTIAHQLIKMGPDGPSLVHIYGGTMLMARPLRIEGAAS